MKKWNLIIYVPVYNVEKQIIPFLKSLSSLKTVLEKQDILMTHVILVNDGSTDSTLEKITRFKSEGEFLKLVNIRKNRGPFQTLMAGMRAASNIIKEEKFPQNKTVVARIDSDMEHDPSSIRDLVSEIKNKKRDLVVGVSDFRDYPFHTRYFNRIIGTSESQEFLHFPIPQFCPGFYAFRADTLESLLPSLSTAGEKFRIKYGKDMLTIDFMVIVLAKRMGCKISTVTLSPVDLNWVKKPSIWKLISYYKYHLNTVKFLRGE